jgi:ADP-ribosyl-[dinitrogen reductase] hydrolase
MVDLLERYTGCLIGLATGDALGGPFEFRSREEIAAEYPNGVREMTGGGWLDLEPGEITDDTSMALDIARSLAIDGQTHIDDLASRFVAWFHSNPKDIGNTTRASLTLLASGVPWDEAGQRVYQESPPAGAAGNGSVMRCAPVALRFRNDRAALRQASIDTARITHADPRCTWGAVVVNQAISALLEGASAPEAIAASIDEVPQPDLIVAVEAVPSLDRSAIASGGYVVDTVTASFWCLLQTASFEDAVSAAVSLGADSDTIGAVTGALAGTHYGISAIPARWAERIREREELDHLAERLLGLSGGR